MSENKTAIITAASKGLGKACAEVMKSKGFNLVLFSRSDLIHEVGRELGVESVQGDITSSSDIQNLVLYHWL